MQRTRLLVLLAITMVAGLLVTGCQGPIDATPGIGIASHMVPHAPENFTIWAGQNESAGVVTVWFDNANLYIKYDLTKGNWWLEETHAHVALKLKDIPQRYGVPKPYRFEFKDEWSPRVKTCTYAIPVRDGWNVGVNLYMATHSVVVKVRNGRVTQREEGWAGPYFFSGGYLACHGPRYIKYEFQEVYKDLTLPTDSVKMVVYLDTVEVGYEPKAHFRVALESVPSGYDVWNEPPSPWTHEPWNAPRDSFWPGWCAEYANGITPSGAQPSYNIPYDFVKWYHVRLWSSQDPNLPDRDPMDNDAWDNVNWLINNKLDGASAQEVQVAFWWLLTPDPETNGLLPKYPLEGNSLTMHDQAIENGEGFHPAKGQWLAVICDAPNKSNGKPTQRVFIEVDP